MYLSRFTLVSSSTQVGNREDLCVPTFDPQMRSTKIAGGRIKSKNINSVLPIVKLDNHAHIEIIRMMLLTTNEV